MNRLLAIIVMLVIAMAVWAEPVADDTSAEALIMVCNAGVGDTYIRITDDMDDTIMETEAIPQYAISRMFRTKSTGYYYLSYKENEGDDWEFYLDDNTDDDFEIELQAGKVCCIVIDADGGVFVNQLTYENTNLPKLCFINMCPGKLNRMEIGTEYTTTYEAFTSDLGPLDMTDFVSIKVGSYGMFWETVEKGNNNEHLFYPDDSGNLFLNPFKHKQWYVFTAYQMDDGDHANLYEISPN